MKPFKFYLSLALMVGGSCTLLPAQTRWENPLSQEIQVIRGRAWQEELTDNYCRLPQYAKEKVRKPVWDLSRQSAGLSVAFRSNAEEIKIRYIVSGALSMAHMPSTGVSGVDMYAIDANGRHRWCAGKYAWGDTVTYSYRGLSYATAPEQGYEYHLYLPLYNTVKWMEIGVPDSTRFNFLPTSLEKPLVIYGTSIAQGACASRPGMAWGNMIERELEHPVINLGFSGNGRLEPELFDLLSEIDARLYIIDCMPNLPGTSSSVIYDRTLAGVRKLREKHNTPILLVEHSGYLNESTSRQAEESYRVANTELRKAYNTLLREGIQEIYYLTKEDIGLTMDAMVEGVHPSDLGMKIYADAYIKKIKEILHENSEKTTVFTPCKQQRDSYDWNKRHEQVLRLNKEKAPEILLIGNSITHYWAGEPSGQPSFGSKSWEKLFRGKIVRNLGFGWDRIENAIWRIYHGELDGYQAKKIFLLAGTNNLDKNTDDEIIEGISELVRAVQQRQPEAKIYVCGILPRAWQETRVALLNKALQMRLHPEEATFIDMASEVTDEKGKIINSLFRDGLHPNEEGYGRMAVMLEKAVKE